MVLTLLRFISQGCLRIKRIPVLTNISGKGAGRIVACERLSCPSSERDPTFQPEPLKEQVYLPPGFVYMQKQGRQFYLIPFSGLSGSCLPHHSDIVPSQLLLLIC